LSRFFVTRRGNIVRRKHTPKPYTEAWMHAREERAQRRTRRGMPEQARNERGFIVKKEVVTVNNRKVLRETIVDPGPISRELYLENKKQRDRDSWEAPNA
jgi:phage antirepressor YoqD-like protein